MPLTNAELEYRVVQLEQRLAKYDAFFTFGLSDDGRIPYVITQGRFGVMTDYWSKQPWGKGAALSVGTITDRYGIYVEVEAAQPGAPSTAVYAAVPVVNPTQRNIAYESHPTNSSVANVDLFADGQGIQVGGNWPAWVVAKLGGAFRVLWP